LLATHKNNMVFQGAGVRAESRAELMAGRQVG